MFRLSICFHSLYIILIRFIEIFAQPPANQNERLTCVGLLLRQNLPNYDSEAVKDKRWDFYVC